MVSPSSDQRAARHPHLDREKGVSMKLSDVDARIPSASVSKAN
jgi:hypothetical protein